MAKQTTTRRAEIGRERRARMRNRLIEAAARVIASHGTDSVSIDTFIRAAGVARGTFYNHFKTREELLDALWSSIGHDPFLEIQSACSKLADPAERFAAVTRLVLLRAADDPTWGWLIVALSADEATLNDDLRGYPRPDLRAGEAAGRFRYESEASATDLVVGTMRASLRALLQETREAHYAQALCRMLLLALGINRIEANRISALPLPIVQGDSSKRLARIARLGNVRTRSGQLGGAP
jgi:AcrR family transcriptional regulator